MKKIIISVLLTLVVVVVLTSGCITESEWNRLFISREAEIEQEVLKCENTCEENEYISYQYGSSCCYFEKINHNCWCKDKEGNVTQLW